MPSRLNLLARATSILLGVLVLLLGYYWVHKPIDAAAVLALGGALLDLVTVTALVVVAAALGRVVWARLPFALAAVSAGERLAFAALLGLGVVSLAALALGMLGGFNGFVLWGGLIVTGGALRRSAAAWLGEGWALVCTTRLDTPFLRFAAFASALLVALALARACAPPHGWDALVYHLVAPARYLAEGRIAAHADNHFLGFPQLGEVLYGVAMAAFGRDTTPALVHCAFGLLGVLLLASAVRRVTDRTAAWTAIMIVLSAYSIWLLMGEPYVDLAAFAYGAAAFTAASVWREHGGRGWLLVAGGAVGFACGVKYTAVSLALLVVVLIVVQHRFAPRRLAASVALFSTAAGLVFLPWLVKGAVLYGNPVYPYLFDGLNWDAGRGATFSGFGSGLLGSPDYWQLGVLPLAATIFGAENAPGFAFTVGAWLFTAPFLLLVCWRWLADAGRRLAGDALIGAVALHIFWLVLAAASSLGVQTRLMAAGLPVAAVLAALGFAALYGFPQKPIYISYIVRGVLVVTVLLALNDAFNTLIREATLDYLLGWQTRDAVLDRNQGAYAGAMRALDELPAESVVRLLYEPRSYGCPAHVVCQPDVLRDHWTRAVSAGQTPDAVMQAWQGEGVDYLLLWTTGYENDLNDPRSADTHRLFGAARDAWLTPIWTDGVRYTLYAWAR